MRTFSAALFMLFSFSLALAFGQERPADKAKPLTTPLQFSTEPDARTVTFVHSRADDPYLVKLRTEFQLEAVIAGKKDAYEQVQAVCHWVRSRWEHNGSNEPKKGDPISILHEAAEGKRFRCVEYSVVLTGALESLGIPARVLALKTKDVETRRSGAGHVVSEAYLRDRKKWIMIDGQWDVVPTLAGKPLHAVELQQALARQDPELGVESFSGTKTNQYFPWIAPYLYFFDMAIDSRYGIIRKPESLMLVPEGAKNPTVFQRKYPMDHMVYTHSLATFYQPPE